MSLTSLFCLSMCLGQKTAGPRPLIPMPSYVHWGPARVEVQFPLSIQGKAVDREVSAFGPWIGRSARYSKGSKLEVDIDASRVDLGEEGYSLRVRKGRISILAKSPAGIFYGLQTFRQLLPDGVESPRFPKRAWVPEVTILDKPRLRWRGVMLDDSRHFFPKKDILRLLDLAALHKLNVFHWHLNDDGGWRIEIKRYPMLTKVGAWRVPSDGEYPQEEGFDRLDIPPYGSPVKKYGGFHTQTEIREIVQYAQDRHITIVPEIDLPGHNLALTKSYPELICSPGLIDFYKKYILLSSPNMVCPGKESTFKTLEGILSEVADLFPSKFIHIGGDEVETVVWDRCPDCIARKANEGLKSGQELQSYLIRRLEAFLTTRGKRIIGWDEILDGGVSQTAAIMSWHDAETGLAAARRGHDVVLAPTETCYLYKDNSRIPISDVLAFEPIPEGLDLDTRKHVLGAEACMWTNGVWDMKTVEYRFFPRLAAMAEVLWAERRESPPQFLERMSAYYGRLDALDVNYRIPPPIARNNVVDPSKGEQVAFLPVGIDRGVIRFTTDGKSPTRRAQRYTEPFTASSGTVTAAVFLPDGRQSADERVTSGPIKALGVEKLEPGVWWRMRSGPLRSLAELSSKPFDARRPAESFRLPSGLEKNFGLEFGAYVKIEKPGTYRFYLFSDDGSDLSIAGHKLVWNDGVHRPQEACGSVNLVPGYYPLLVRYFQRIDAREFVVKISGPGIRKQEIPPELLWRKAP